MYRTHLCGELRASHAGQTVTLSGWVNRRRDHGGVAFFDLRDRAGIVQITINPDLPKEMLDLAADVRNEWVLQIEGVVQKRPEGMANPKMTTGEVEVIAKNVTYSTRRRLPHSWSTPMPTCPTRTCASNTATLTCAANDDKQHGLASQGHQVHARLSR
jgi:aspartyl-tRNA synthetase